MRSRPLGLLLASLETTVLSNANCNYGAQNCNYAQHTGRWYEKSSPCHCYAGMLISLLVLGDEPFRLSPC